MNAKTADEILVPTTKSAAMRYMLEAVEHGYHHYHFGVLPSEKVLSVATRLAEKYNVLATRSAREYAKKKNRACARLVLFPLDDQRDNYDPAKVATEDRTLRSYRPRGSWVYYLLATDGTGPVHEQEKLRDAREEPRLQWQRYYLTQAGLQPQYELVARPVRSRNGTAYHWTWRMSSFLYDLMDGWTKKAAGRVRSSKEKHPHYLIAALDALRSQPGFRLVREQARRIIINADIPKDAEVDTHIGGYTDKSQQVFLPGRTLGALLAPQLGTDPVVPPAAALAEVQPAA